MDKKLSNAWSYVITRVDNHNISKSTFFIICSLIFVKIFSPSTSQKCALHKNFPLKWGSCGTDVQTAFSYTTSVNIFTLNVPSRKFFQNEPYKRWPLTRCDVCLDQIFHVFLYKFYNIFFLERKKILEHFFAPFTRKKRFPISMCPELIDPTL